MAKLPRVAIIGRANVGKSTLFNRLTSGPKAIVADVAGTTRDRKEGVCTWLGRQFTLIDTGGLDVDPQQPIEQKIAEQAIRAVEAADLVLFVVDTKDGITPVDNDIANLLRPIRERVLVVANKVDAGSDDLANAFFKLGYDKPWPISAINGRGTGDLLDHISKLIKPTLYKEEDGIRVAIIGKPNVGKSSLINALTGEERSIVHDEPYTTRDANEVTITYNGKRIILLDTAGVRRKSRIDINSLEKESVYLSLDAIRKADVVLLVTECQEKLTAQDLQLARLIEESRASAIIIGNKWDVIEDKDVNKMREFEEYYRKMVNFLYWAPILFMSAQNRTKLTKLKELIIAVNKERYRKITDNALSKFLKMATKRQKPTIDKGTKKPFIYKIRQDDVNPPSFAVVIDYKSSIQYTYLNFLKKLMREKFGFEGSPIKMWVEKNREPRKPNSPVAKRKK